MKKIKTGEKPKIVIMNQSNTLNVILIWEYFSEGNY